MSCTVLDDATGHGRQCTHKLRNEAMPHFRCVMCGNHAGCESIESDYDAT